MTLRIKLLLALATLLGLMGATTYWVNQYWQGHLLGSTQGSANAFINYRQLVLQQQWQHAQELLEQLAADPRRTPGANAGLDGGPPVPHPHPAFVALRWQRVAAVAAWPTIDRVGRTPVMWFRVNVPGRAGLQLAGARPLADLLKPALSKIPTPGAGVLILDQKNQLLGSSFNEPADALTPPTPSQAPHTHMVWEQAQNLPNPLSLTVHTSQATLGNETFFSYTKYLPELDWTLAYAVPASVMLQPIHRTTGMGLLALGLVLGAGLVVGWLIERSLLGPIHRLQAAYTQLAQGQQGVRVQVHGRDELAELSADFNDTAASLEAAEQRFRRIFEAFPYPVVLTRMSDGSFLDVNPAYVKVSGRSQEDLLAPAPLREELLGDLTQWEQSRQLLLDNGQLDSQAVQVTRPDGERRWVLYSTRLIELHHESVALTVTTDITELKAHEQVLRDHDARLRTFHAMVEGAADGMMLIDDGVIGEANPAVERLFGVGHGGLAGRTPVDLSPPAQLDGRTSAEAAHDYLAQAAQRGNVRFEWQHLHQDGHAFTAEVRLSGVEGTPGRVIAVVRDVTERYAAQRALARSETRYRQLHDNMLEGFVANRLDGRVTQSNTAFRHMLGYDEAQLRQLRYQDFTPAHWHDLDQKMVREQVLVRGHSDLYEKEYTDASGRTFPVEVRAYLDTDEAGTPVGLWSLVRDISERKQAERALVLQASEERLQAVLAATGDGVWDCDMVRGQTYASPRWIKMLGLPPDSNPVMDARNMEDFVYPEDQPLSMQTVVRCIKINQPFSVELRMVRADGQVIWVRDRGNVIERDAQGRALRMVGSLQDITQQKTAELALLQAKAQTEAANADLSLALEDLKRTQDELLRSEKLAALGSLVAGVAHELNTPLGNAITVTTTVQDAHKRIAAQVQGGLTRSALQAFLTSVSEGTAMLERNLQRAANLVSNFRQLAVDQSSHQQRRFDLCEAVEEVRLVMAPTVRKAGVVFVSDVAPGTVLHSYPGALTQGLIIVVNNALVHAFADGRSGTVTLQAGPAQGGWVRLTVSDDGAGIAPEHLGRVFEPFFTTRLGQGGSGLGMHLLYNLVTGVLGGRVDVQSTVGQGTAVHLDLPLDAPLASHEALSNWAA